MKKEIFSIFFIILFTGCIASNNTIDKKTSEEKLEISIYEAYLIKTPPLLDGKLDDECWKILPSAKCFFIIGGNEFAMTKPSFFKVGWDNENFYFAFFAEEPETNKIVAKRPDGDKSLWMEDSVELFLIPPGLNCWQFIINAKGSRWNGDGFTGATLPLENWEAKTFIGENFWSIEVKIPFKILGKVPQNDEKWKINVGRNNITGPLEERVSCWPKIIKSFHEIENFGIILFKKEYLSLKTVKPLENKINEPRYNILKDRIKNLVELYNTDYKKSIEKGVSIPSFSQQAEQIMKNWEIIIDYNEKMKKEKEIELKDIYDVFLKTKGIKEKTEELKQKIEFESLFN